MPLKTCVLIILLTTALPVSAQTQPSAAMDQATKLFQAQKFEEAAQAFTAVTRSEPTNARAFYWLGTSLYALSKFEDAAAAFQRAVEIAHNPQPMFELAKTYAQLNDKDRAIEWLEKALNGNLPNSRRVASEPAFTSLRENSKFTALAEKAIKAGMVCMNTPEYRQFDFWLGDWDVFNKSDQRVGSNTVQMLEDGCIVSENWTSAQGSTGKSYNFYNPITRKWHQSYMDTQGGNWMMDGEYKDGALKYEGAIYSPSGKVLVHMTFFNLGPDKVRQWAETSSDDGKTWQVIWDAMYLRKK